MKNRGNILVVEWDVEGRELFEIRREKPSGGNRNLRENLRELIHGVPAR